MPLFRINWTVGPSLRCSSVKRRANRFAVRHSSARRRRRQNRHGRSFDRGLCGACRQRSDGRQARDRADQRQGRHPRTPGRAAGGGFGERRRHRRAEGAQADRARQRQFHHRRRQFRHRGGDRPGQPEKKILHIVSGGHTDSITGKDCKWNVFRVCNTTRMEANSVSDLLFTKYGKKWHFITPDYAFGHTLHEACADNLKKLGGTMTGNELTPLGTTDFSAYLIKARRQSGRAAAAGAGLRHDQLPQADRAVRPRQADPCRRHAAGARIARRAAAGGAHRHLDVRVVLEAAGRSARRKVRRRYPQGERRQGADRAPLVRLYLGA